MTKRTWLARPATREDIPAIRTLFAQVMGFQRPIEHERWKFAENPFGEPLAMLAEDSERVVGLYALWPTLLHLGNERVLGAQSLDTMTHPEYQGQGMFTHLASTCYELAAARGVGVVYGFPNASSYAGFVRRLNWHHTGDFRSWVRLIRPALHPRIPRAFRPIVSAVAAALPVPAPAGYSVVPGWPETAEMDTLLSSRPERDRCMIARVPQWMAYRFGAAGGRSYQPVAVYHASTLKALAVWGRDPFAEYPRAILADLLGDDPTATRAAVAGAVLAARQSGVASINTLASHRFLPALRACGFFPGRSVPFVVRQLTARTLPASIHMHEAWDVIGADLDTL